MLSTLFFIKRTKSLKNGESPIFLRLTTDKQRTEISLGRSIKPEQWIVSKSRARPNSPKNKQLNAFLDQQDYLIYSLQKELTDEGVPITSSELARRYRGDDNQHTMIIELYSRHNQHLMELVGKTVAKATYTRHCTSLRLFQKFLNHRYRKQDMLVREITTAILEEYRHYMTTVRNACNNTVVKYLRNLGKVLNMAVTEGILRQSPMERVVLKLEDVEKDFLTQIELDALVAKKFAIPRLAQVRDSFVFCCYTGLAYIDVHSLTGKDLVSGKEGKQWIYKARQKTRNMCYIPLLSPALKILERYGDQAKVTGKLLPVLSNQKMNAYLKEIADVCGIDKTLTTHCARHTFATTVTLANSVTIENVSKMLGHSNIQMTQHYAKIMNSSIERDMAMVEISLKSV